MRPRANYTGLKFSGLARLMDGLVMALNPRAGMQRIAYRSSYEVLSNSRLYNHKKRSLAGWQELDEYTLGDLRDRARWYTRNNSTISGMLQTEVDEICGDDFARVQSRAKDKDWAKKAEEHWREKMVESPVDVTGQYNFPTLGRMLFGAGRGDGDSFAIFTDDAIQMLEGEQCGTPIGKTSSSIDIISGKAFSKTTKKLLGYYFGEPDKWGIINNKNWKAYRASDVFHFFKPKRISHVRGEPALTSAMRYIEMLDGYEEAEAVAARINACFAMFISRKDAIANELAYDDRGRPTGRSVDRPEKIYPGQILYGEDGESATGIGMQRPGAMFEAFVKFMQIKIGRGICMPLMLLTLNFEGATFMNARIANQQAQKFYRGVQKEQIVPFTRRSWKWFIDNEIATGQLEDNPQKYKIQIFCNRWPYVNPLQEAQANKIKLENRETNRTKICADNGDDFREIEEQAHEDEKLIGVPAGKNTNEMTEDSDA